MLAATLACGDGAVVSHLTAATLLDLRDRTPVVIDVIARGQSGRGIDGIRCHHVPPPQAGERGRCRGVPCTSPSRTIIDLAGTLGERPLRHLVERAAVLRLLDSTAIDESLAQRRRRGGQLLRSILRSWRPTGAPSPVRSAPPLLRSELEARLLMLVGATDLPQPRCNAKVETDAGSFVVDFLWPSHRIVVETDGWRFHDDPIAFERDRRRDRALQASGYRVVRITHLQIEEEPQAVISSIRRLLAREVG
jgi:very-short-patch-repair endonuclease